MKRKIRIGQILIDPGIRFGKPCIKGTRITVGDILDLLSAGYTVDQIPKQYKGITKRDVLAAIAFAVKLSEQPSKIALQA